MLPLKLSKGWGEAPRKCRPIPEPDPGYVAVSHSWAQDPADPFSAAASLVQMTVADWDAQQAAEAEAARISVAAPEVMSHGIEVPVLVLTSETNQVGVGVVATDGGDLVTYIEHESPSITPEERAARIAAKVRDHNGKKQAAKDGLNGQLQQRLENLERLLGVRE